MSKHNRQAPVSPRPQAIQAQQGDDEEQEASEQEAFESADSSATTDEGHADSGLSKPHAPPSRPQAPMAAQPRVYKGTQTVDHDLYKLKVATMKKDIGWNPKKPDMVAIEHVHIFHTIDSNGKRQTACGQVGGHHHDVEVIHGAEGHAPTIKVSGPRIYIRNEDGMKVSVPLNRPGIRNGDYHTHEVEYLNSEKIKIRETSLEFAKFQSAMTQVQSPKVEGVVSR